MRAIWCAVLAGWLALAPATAQTLDNGVPRQTSSPASPVIENDDERAAFKAGRYYIFTTGNNGVPAQPGLQVAAGSFLNARICNSSLTRTYYIAPFGRFIDSSSTVITPYYGITQPDALSTAQAATLTGCGAVSPNTCNLTYGTNLFPGKPAQSDITMAFGVGSAMTVNAGGTAVPTGNGVIYPNVKNEITKPRALPPAIDASTPRCFGQALVGQGGTGGLGGTAAIYLIYRAYIYYDQ